MVVIWILARFPAIECLVDHEHPQPVASVEEINRRRIVAGADCIKAIGLEYFDPTLLGARNRSGPERSVVVMDTSSAQFDALAINPQPLRCVEFQFAKAKMNRL